MSKKYDLIILGAGPAGMTAGIYAMRAQLDTILLEKNFVNGGQILNTHEVDNYPGIPRISGIELGEAFENHAKGLGLPIEQGEVLKIHREEQGFRIETEEKTYEARTVIIAAGARPRPLLIPGEKELAGMGVSYCATCDGAFFKGKTVAVAGGGDVALEDAIYLARTCEKVYLIHRRDELRGAVVLQEELKGLANVEILYSHTVEEIRGEDAVESLLVRNGKTGENEELKVSGLFVAVGIRPNTELVKDCLKLDPGGYIIAGEDCATELPGLFAAGDVRRKPIRQIITAVADGANAAVAAGTYCRQ